jgi:hypothetical protein
VALRLRGDLPFLKQIVAFEMPDPDSLRNSRSTFVQLVESTHHSLLFNISSFGHNWERFPCFAWAKEMAVSGLEVYGLPFIREGIYKALYRPRLHEEHVRLGGQLWTSQPRPLTLAERNSNELLKISAK